MNQIQFSRENFKEIDRNLTAKLNTEWTVENFDKNISKK
jgi:hypothetical protein